ncbi:MAG TPA: HDOD domain-containing protein [Thermoleophilaceae bacterium]
MADAWAEPTHVTDLANNPSAPSALEHETVPAAASQPDAPERVELMAARHPIYDEQLHVAAYELVLHAREADGGLSAGHGAATPEAVTAVADALIGSHPVHVKVSREVLLSGAATTVPADRIVLEVPPEAGCDELLADALHSLRRTGHSVVLDNFRYQEDAASLARSAQAIKLDAGTLHPDQLTREVKLARGLRDDIRLIATGIGTHDTFDLCRDLGFELFQGFFFLEPEPGDRETLKPSQAARIRLLGSLQGDCPDFDRLEEIISQDIGLSYALLRFVNSAFFALPRDVQSVRDAAVLLGSSNMRRWATLSVLADSAEHKPGELVLTGLTRARMCELLTPAYGQRDVDAFFTAGLFSIVDALMDVPMVHVLSSLPLSREINSAILNFDGQKGEALRAAVAWERGNLGELITPPTTSVGEVGEMYRDAVMWAASAAAGLRPAA